MSGFERLDKTREQRGVGEKGKVKMYQQRHTVGAAEKKLGRMGVMDNLKLRERKNLNSKYSPLRLTRFGRPDMEKHLIQLSLCGCDIRDRKYAKRFRLEFGN